MELNIAVERLKKLQKERRAYRHALDIVFTDGVTAAPEKSWEGREAILEVLNARVREIFINDEVGALLSFLREHIGELDEITAREVTILSREYDRVCRIPADEYIQFKVLVGQAEAIWPKAKTTSDFELFAPYLERIVETNRRFAGYIAPEKVPYDALLDDFEYGMSSQTLDKFMELLKQRLLPLIAKINTVPQIEDPFAGMTFDLEAQKKLSHYLMELMGLDESFVTLSTSEHPFSTAFHRNDVRMTTHYYEDDFQPSMYSVIHEGGHSLYEHNIDDSLMGSVLGHGESAGLHESQSRFYENYIGKSREFISLVLPKLKELFPAQFKDITDDELYRVINRVQPGALRLDADELTYPFHILIRYELEKRMIDGTLAVRDVPQEWNRLYKEYLGVDVPDDGKGVLQDCHWSDGGFGYFPTYALGSAYGAQMYQAMNRGVDVRGTVARGELATVTAWLKEHVHRCGYLYDPAEAVRQACGEFDPIHYVNYLEEKFSAIYGI